MVIGCFSVLVGILFVCTQLLDIKLHTVVPVSSYTLAYAPLILSVVIIVLMVVFIAAVVGVPWSLSDVRAKYSSTVAGSGSPGVSALAECVFLR